MEHTNTTKITKLSFQQMAVKLYEKDPSKLTMMEEGGHPHPLNTSEGEEEEETGTPSAAPTSNSVHNTNQPPDHR